MTHMYLLVVIQLTSVLFIIKARMVFKLILILILIINIIQTAKRKYNN